MSRAPLAGTGRSGMIGVVRVVSLLCIAWLVVVGRPAHALPPSSQARVVEAARTLLGAPYRLGGRLKASDDGIDCQGLVFFAFQTISSCGWRSYSVFPTVSLPTDELGRRVAGPIATRDVATLRLEPGDVLWLVGYDENPAEKSIGALDDKPVWVWHLGLATGEGRFINADVFTGKVIEVGLREYLKEHADFYAGVIVTRVIERPSPRTCRRHSPMLAPATGQGAGDEAHPVAVPRFP